MNIKVLVLDTQVYFNSGGQSSAATFMGQNTKFTVHAKAIPGKWSAARNSRRFA